jgi:hypothetical protein
MSLPEISNEQKLTYIYYTLKNQEARHRRAMWYRIFKWMIVLAIVYILATYPGYVFTKVSELLRPIIVEQAQTILDDNRNSITKSLNNVMTSIKALMADTTEPSSENTETPPAVEVPKTTTPVKKTGTKKTTPL